MTTIPVTDCLVLRVRIFVFDRFSSKPMAPRNPFTFLITSAAEKSPENVISSQYRLYVILLSLHQPSIYSSNGFITRLDMAAEAGEPWGRQSFRQHREVKSVPTEVGKYLLLNALRCTTGKVMLPKKSLISSFNTTIFPVWQAAFSHMDAPLR